MFFTSLPTGIIPTLTYPFHFAAQSSAVLNSSCGPVTRVSSTTAVLAPIHATFGVACSIGVVGVSADVWMPIAVDPNSIFLPPTYFQATNSTVAGTVGVGLAPTSAALPQPLQVFQLTASLLFGAFANASALPPGIELETKSGVFSGTPTAVGTTTVDMYVVDTTSGLSEFVGSVQFVIAPPPSAGQVSPSAYLVPIFVLLAAAAVLWMHLQRDRRKLFHVFISYRVATDAGLAEYLCFKLQQRFLASGHRVRCDRLLNVV